MTLLRGRDFTAITPRPRRESRSSTKRSPRASCRAKSRWANNARPNREDLAEVVGIARTAPIGSLGERAPRFLYRPFCAGLFADNEPDSARRRRSGRLVAGCAAKSIRSTPTFPLQDIRTCAEHVWRRCQPARAGTLVLSRIQPVGIVPGGPGIYGVMSYAVARRTQKSACAWRWARDVPTC